jgi:hypothetical protein
MRKILFFGLAAVMMAACSNDDSISPLEPGVGTEGSRYMAISLATNVQNTRADEYTPVYSQGSANEYAVSSQTENLVFYFFDADGKPYEVDEVEVNDEKKPVNYLNPKEFGNEGSGTSVSFTTQTDGENVTSISNLILTFNKETGTTPAQVVALVNAPDDFVDDNLYVTLAELQGVTRANGKTRNALVENSDDEYFLMSNSVYQDAASGEIVTATSIEPSNIAYSIADAAAAPVQIYVERLDAKVTFKGSSDSNTDFDKSGGDVYYKVKSADITANVDAASKDALGVSASDDNVYVKVEGWTLFNKTDKTNLIKSLTKESGTPWWNNASDHRSYWANTPSDAGLDATSLTYNNVLTLSGVYDAEKKVSIEGVDGNAHIEYALENTLTPAKADDDVNTGFIMATRLYTKGTEGNFAPLELAKWLSRYYTVEQLQRAIASYLGKSLWYSEDGETTRYTISGAWDEITFKQNAGGPSYTVLPVLKENSKKTWYASANATDALDKAGVDAILATVPAAQIWTDGMCYYYTPITHKIGDVENKAVVRNHWYRVGISSITGLGTPVWDADSDTFDPTNPSDDDDKQWYLDAQINVLSWNMLDNDVEFTTKKNNGSTQE